MNKHDEEEILQQLNKLQGLQNILAQTLIIVKAAGQITQTVKEIAKEDEDESK